MINRQLIHRIKGCEQFVCYFKNNVMLWLSSVDTKLVKSGKIYTFCINLHAILRTLHKFWRYLCAKYVVICWICTLCVICREI